MAYVTDWLIGSYPNLEEQTMTVTDGGAEPCVVPAGNYYLYEDLASPLNLLVAVQTAIESHSAIGSGNLSVFFGDDRYIRIFATTGIFSLVWPTDGILRDLLGFTGTLSGDDEYTAPNISPLLWSPGKPTTWEARVGTDGILVRDIAVGQSGPGTVRATSFNRYRKNTLIYRYLANARMWTEDEEGGEFFTFFDQVLAERRRFKVWRGLLESDTFTGGLDADGLGATGIVPRSGAYIYAGPSEMPWAREFGFTDVLHPVSIPVVTTREYDAP